MTSEEDFIGPDGAAAAAEAFRCIRGVLLGQPVSVSTDAGLERLAQLCGALAGIAASTYVAAAQATKGLDEDEGRRAALAEVEQSLTAFELALLDGGQIPPPPPQVEG